MSVGAPTVSCPSCGAALPVDPSRAWADCAYCRARAPVPEAVRAQARAYTERLGRAQSAFDTAREQTAQEQWRATATRLAPWVTGAGFALTMVAVLALALTDLIELQWPVYLAIVPALLGVSWRFVAPAIPVRGSGARLVGEAVTRCAACGGPVRYRMHETSAVCPSCHATTVVSAAVGVALDLQANVQVRSAEGDQARATFGRMLVELRDAHSGWTAPRLAMPLALLGGLGVAGAGAMMLGDAANDNDVQSGWFFIVAGALAAVVALAAMVWRRLFDPWPARVRSLLREAARAAQGRFDEGDARATLGWLAQHWGAHAPLGPELEQVELRQGLWLTLELAPAGCPALVVVALRPAKRAAWMADWPVLSRLAPHEPVLARALVARPGVRDDDTVGARPEAEQLRAVALRVRGNAAGAWVEPVHPRAADALLDARLLSTVLAVATLSAPRA